jgi:uncharacterized protein (DUF2141 family)
LIGTVGHEELRAGCDGVMFNTASVVSRDIQRALQPKDRNMSAFSRFSVLGATALALLVSAPVLAADVEISIRNVRSADGHIMVALYADEAAYTAQRQTMGSMLPATLGEVKAVFAGLPEGRYGIAVFHDIDGDEKLGTNVLGYPTEPFGFGNDPEVRFSRPAFNATAIAVSGSPTSTTVTLK